MLRWSGFTITGDHHALPGNVIPGSEATRDLLLMFTFLRRRFKAAALILLLTCPAILRAQTSIPVILGQTPTILPPTVDASGKTILFASGIDPCTTITVGNRSGIICPA